MRINPFNDRNTYLLRLIKIAHFLLTVLVATAIWHKFCHIDMIRGLHSEGIFATFYAIIYFLLSHIYRAYDLGYSRVMDLTYSHILTSCLINSIMYAGNCIVVLHLINPLPFMGMVVVQGFLGMFWAFGANKLYFSLVAPKRTVVVYRNQSDLKRLSEIRNFSYRFKVEGYIENPNNDFESLLKKIEGYEAVFVVGVHATLRNAIVKYCSEYDVCGYISPHIGDIIVAGGMQIHTYGIPISEVRRAHARIEYRVIKRLFDIFVACVGILLAGPIMLITAAAIKLYDGGDVLYRQTRLTKDEKRFTILKFRSMRCDAEKDGVARLATENDSRVTPVGRVIRASRIDELPQLFNVLMGDMSLVGPRPERPEIAAQYESMIPAFKLRLQVKAGLTGYAQVYGRYNTEPYDKLQMDLIYISRMSLAEDIKLVLATIKILFIKESTQGVEAGRTTAAEQREAQQHAERGA